MSTLQKPQERELQLLRVPLFYGIILRVILVLYFPTLYMLLDERVEISTPITSYKSLMEGIYLFKNSIPVYNGGPPVFLLFGYLNDFAIVLLFLGADYLIAKALVQIAEFKVLEQNNEIWPDYIVAEEKKDDAEDSEPLDTVEIDEQEEKDSLPQIVKREWQDPNEDETLIPTDPTKPIDIPLVPSDIGSIYLFNPFSIITFLARNINIFTSLSIVYAILYALKGKRRLSMLCCAISSWLSLYPLVILAPCVFILKQKKGIAEFVFYLAGLHFLSYLFNNDYLESYKTIVFITDLRPNVGLFWYFFQEVFEQFRIFFYSVFHVNSFIFTIPILIKFSHKPILASGLIVGFISMFKSYPSITDIPLYTSLLLVNSELLKYTGPLFFNLWIYNGSGNSNFYYAITLLWGVTQTMFCVDLIFAQIKRDFEKSNPGWRKSRVDLIYQ
ncbi:hypothetical protein HDV06_003484 [Boothiomyces sp. JEL0866]|nr:hypothetical protein HDV06_003484 [Boothiomyces sp. JEL0866]